MNPFDDLINTFDNLHLNLNNVQTAPAMDAATVENLLTSAIRRATEQSTAQFQATINELKQRLDSLAPPSTAEEFKDIAITPGVECNETLDIVKSIPEFKGDPIKYVSWRQAAVTAHKLFEPYQGSSKYYQAVAIMRNKVIGNADSVLSSYNTVLNFKAIIARLDFAYSDKKSIYTLEQELSTLRQGQKSINQFYDDVERKLTSIINKVIMSHEGDASLIASLNQKYRQDALRVFISGLKKPLCTTLFSCKPPDMPSALALAQELETNQNRYHFAEVYNNGLGRAVSYQPQNRQTKPYHQASFSQMQSSANPPTNFSQPNHAPMPLPGYSTFQQPSNRSQRTLVHNNSVQAENSGFQSRQSSRNPPFQQGSLRALPTPQPMDIDQSMRTARSNNFPNTQGEKRLLGSDKQIPRKIQRINHLGEELPEDTAFADNEYLEQLTDYEQDESDPSFEDEINFLGESQFSPTSNE